MNQTLNGYLREEEHILWRGKTDSFPLLDNTTKFQILCKWILTVALAVGLLVLYFYENPVRNVSFVAIIAAVATVILISPLLERRSLLGQRYWLTNQRAILMGRNKTLYYMELADIDDYQLVQNLGVQDCLVMGSGIFEEIHKQLRWRGCHPKIDLQSQDPQDCVRGMVFYCADHLDLAVTLLEHRGRIHVA